MSATGTIRAPVEALRRCEMVTRTRARNFYHGLKLLPEPKRSGMFALYAWMRAADDLVDDGTWNRRSTQPDATSHVVTTKDGVGSTHVPGGGAARRGSLEARIRAFRESTSRAMAGDPPEDSPMWTALAFTAERFNLSEDPFHAMLDGQLDDAEARRYATFEDLRQYSYRVASTVGLLCIQVWGYTDPAAEEHAVERGIAFQLTNILRDFREDYDSGRVYLPEEDFIQHELTPEEVRTWSKPEQCTDFIIHQVERAASYYYRSQQLDDLIDQSCRPTLWAMTTIYRGLLDKIAANPARLVSDRRVRLSWPKKAMIALRARTGRMNNG